MSVEDNIRSLLHAMGRFSAADLDGYLGLYDDAVVLHGYTPEPLSGREQVRAFYEGVFGTFSDIELRSDDAFGDGDKAVTRFTMSVTHTGEFWGAPPGGARASASGITNPPLRGRPLRGALVELRLLGLLMQIGAIPAPAPA